MGLLHPLLFSSLPREPLAVGALPVQEQVLGVAPMGQYPWAFYNQVPWARQGESPRCSTSCPRCPSSFKWPLHPHQPREPRQQLPVALHPPPASVLLSHRAPAPPPTARSWPPLHPLLASLSCSLYPPPHPLKVSPALDWAAQGLGLQACLNASNLLLFCLLTSSAVSFSCAGPAPRWLSPAAAWEGTSALGHP
jgi:hypothetical protein